jgi:hypothetical protein
VKTKTRKYEKQDFKKKIENFNTGISKSRLGCFTFWNAQCQISANDGGDFNYTNRNHGVLYRYLIIRFLSR